MVYTLEEYVKEFTVCGKHISVSTLKRRLSMGLFPKYHKAYKKPNGWIIEVPELNGNLTSNFNINLTLKKEETMLN